MVAYRQSSTHPTRSRPCRAYCTREPQAARLSCLQDFRRRPVNVAVIRLEKMKFSLLNLLLLTAIICLLIALVCVRRSSVVHVGNYHDWWDVNSRKIASSDWSDKSITPKLSQEAAFSVGDSICKHLNSNADLIGCDNWNVGAVSLESLTTLGAQKWVYLLRLDSNILDKEKHVSVTFLVLMDGTIIFPAKEYKPNFSDSVMSYPNIIDGSSIMSQLPNWCPLD